MNGLSFQRAENFTTSLPFPDILDFDPNTNRSFTNRNLVPCSIRTPAQKRLDAPVKITRLINEFIKYNRKENTPQINFQITANEQLKKAVRKINRYQMHEMINQTFDNTLWTTGYRPVHWAASVGNYEAIKIMARVPGFDPNIKNTGWRPLHTAICRLSDKDPQLLAQTVKTLLKLGADANYTSNRCHLPLQYAISQLGTKGFPTYSALIVGYGDNRANLNYADTSGYTPLEYTKKCGFERCSYRIG